MSGGSLLIVRAEVADPVDRPPFDEWYRDEHLPQALAAFEAKRAWRCWSKLDPSVHYAFYEFSDADAALTVVHSAATKHLRSLFDEARGGRVTRTRDAVETVHTLPHSD
jgi:hypothetical protein